MNRKHHFHGDENYERVKFSKVQLMNSDRTLQDQITEYRAQFEKSMASIAAYQNKAQVEVAEIRTLHKEIADQHKEIEKLVKEVADQQKKTASN